MHNISLDKNDIFGAGTQKAVNNILKTHGYSQNGTAGKKFIDLLGNELL
jgi:lysozyme